MVRDELMAHMEDQKEAYMAEGLEEEAAAQRAVAEMGDPTAVGMELDAAHRPKPSWSVMGGAALLALLGGCLKGTLAMTAGSSMGEWAAVAVLGAVITVAIYFMNFNGLAKGPIAAYLGAFAAAWYIGAQVRGPFQENIGYVLSIAAIPFYALIVHRYRKQGMTGVMWCMLWLAVGVLGTIGVPSLYAALILSVTGAILLTLAIERDHFGGRKRQQLALLYGTGILGGGALLLARVLFLSSRVYAADRLSALFPFLNSNGEDLGMSYWPNAMAQLYRGSVFFSGQGADVNPSLWEIMKSSEEYQDFYFLNYAAVTQGVWLSLAMMTVFLVFWWVLMRTARRQKNTVSYLVCISVCIVFGLSALFFILQNMGLLYLGRSMLPFLSAEPLGFLACAFMLGIFLSASKGNGYLRDKDMERELAEGIEGAFTLWLRRHVLKYRLVIRLEKTLPSQDCHNGKAVKGEMIHENR